MKVLIVGGAGYVGGGIVDLLSKDNEVTFDDFGTIADYVFIIGNMKDIPLEVNE